MRQKYETLTTTSICQQCGKEFTYPTRFAQKFCSLPCRFAAQVKRETRSCVICDTEYIVRPSSKVRVCSKVCKNKLNAISNTDESTHATSVCPACEKPFTYLASWPRKYCCRACAATTVVANIKRFKHSGFTTTCESCGKEFETTPQRTRGRFCSLACYGKWRTANNVGTNTGKKLGRPKSLPLPLTKTCPICESSFSVKPSHTERRRFGSRACLGKRFSLNGSKGENSPTWLGGCEPYRGESWRYARRAARQRDNQCADCGKTPDELGRALDVHHIIPFRNFGRDRHLEANDLSNLVSLCNICHLKREWASGNRKKVIVLP